MHIIKIFGVAVCASCIVGGCAPLPPAQPPRSQLEVRELQTREYDMRDSRLVMKALLNVLQDDGFIVHNAVVDLGLITATKEVEMDYGPYMIGSMILMGQDASWATNSVIEASVNVTEAGKLTKVRINFQRKVLDNRGGTVSVKQVDEARYYRDFFSKVDKGIFLQGEQL